MLTTIRAAHWLAVTSRDVIAGRVDAGVLGLVAMGGALGSLARWACAESFAGPGPAGGGFPWSTLLVNVVGSLALGVLAGWMERRPAAPWWLRPLLAVGVLGGFTTFSTYVLDARGLLAGGHGDVGALALVGGVLAGAGAVVVGLAVGRRAGSRPDRRTAGGAG